MPTAQHVHCTSFADARPTIIEEFEDDSCKEKYALQTSGYKRVHAHLFLTRIPTSLVRHITTASQQYHKKTKTHLKIPFILDNLTSMVQFFLKGKLAFL